MEAHDHNQFPDPTDPKKILMGCDCFCVTCYSEEQRQTGEKGCICPDCLCNTPQELHPLYFRAESVEPSTHGEEHPHGTCETCGANTYRKGTRGRFPKLCPRCKP